MVLKVVADAIFDGNPVPIEFVADTLYEYVVDFKRPVSENVVPVLPVLEIVFHVLPPSVDLSIL